MVDFAKTDVQEIPVNVTAGTQAYPSSSKGVSSAALVSGVGTLTKSFGDIFDQFVTSGNNKVVSGFAQEQLKLAEAVDQGILSSKEARMRARANFSSVAADNPNILGELQKAHAAILETAGLGKIIADGTPEEKRLEAERDDAFKAGYVLPTDNAREALEGLEAFRENKQQVIQAEKLKRDQDAIKAELEIAGKRTSNETASMNLDSLKLKKKAKELLVGFADTNSIVVRKEFKQINQDLANGTITPEEAVRRSETFLESTVGQIPSGVIAEDQGLTEALIKPMRDMKLTYQKFWKGEITKEIMDNTISNAVAKQKLMAVNDPKVARIVAVTQLLGNSATTIMPAIDTAVLEFVGKGIQENASPDVTPSDPDEKRTVGTFLNLVKGAMGSKDQRDAAQKKLVEEELSKHVDSIFNGVAVNEGKITGASSLNQVVDFLASSEFGSYASNKTGLPSQYAPKAAAVIERYWSDDASRVIQEEYEKADARVGGGFDTSLEKLPRVVQPQFNGTGVIFKVTPGREGDTNIIGFTLRHLNERVSPLVNKLIRINAHLKGGTNYKQSWEELRDSIFEPQKVEEGTKEGK